MRIAHASFLPPFAEHSAGRSHGLVVEILVAATGRAGMTAELLPVPFEEMVPALLDGRADLAIPVAVTPERRQRLDFSDTLLMTGGALFVRAPAPTPAGLSALTGMSVVTPRPGPLAAFIAKVAPDVRLIQTEDYETSLAMLVRGEADAAALNHQAGAMIASRLHAGAVTLPQTMFLELPFAAATAKGSNADLLAALNSGLAAIRADGSWRRILDAWDAASQKGETIPPP